MTEESALRALAAALGVATSYRNVQGQVCEPPVATLRAICECFGYAAGDEGAVTAAHEALIRAQWRDLAPPVATRRGDSDTLEILLTARRDRWHGRILWDLAEENGNRHTGEAPTEALAVAETIELDGRFYERRRLVLKAEFAFGYHRLRVAFSGDPPLAGETQVIVAPQCAYQPPSLAEGKRVWAMSAQLYSLRSATNWGIGDFTDLATVAGCAGRCGADALGINPLHSLFPDDPERASPYSPSSRLFLNPLYLDLPEIEDFAESDAVRAAVTAEGFIDDIESVRDASLVDYIGVARLKARILPLLFAHFREHHLGKADDPRTRAFRAFQADGGAVLRRFAIFEALRATLGADDHALRDWRNWPPALRTPDAHGIADFLRRHADRIEFVEYQQWQAQRQLSRACERAAAAGLSIGLYRDLAVGVDPAGADAWANQSVFATGFTAGAPPDAWSPDGQNWGFSPFHPENLRRSAYRILAQALRANMRSTGALRIDHVLGLMRMFWIPEGGKAADGTYVGYVFDELLACVVLESHRNRCLVVGEDLGTLPEGLQDALQQAGLYSYRLLYFERESDRRFRRPQDVAVQAAAAITTHDLPTVAGFWQGRDIQLRQTIRPDVDSREARRLLGERQEDCRLLRAAIAAEGFADEGEASAPPFIGIHGYLARSGARLVIVQIEDLIGEVEQANLPGTYREHPNWQRKLPRPLAAIFSDAGVHAILSAIRKERPRAGERREGRRHRTPVATYRVQLNAQFGFDALQAILAYLYELGVSHVYVSPFMRARPGSTHGYDVIDPNAINPEIGDAESLERLSDALAALDMGLVLDFVPNHMGIAQAGNEWWLDLLQWGPSSPYALFFDIDWHSPKPELNNKLLLPFLGDHYGAVLQAGELTLQLNPDAGLFFVAYREHRFPIRPRHYALILHRAAAEAATSDEALGARLDALAASFAALRPEGEARGRRAEIWHRGRALRIELADAMKDSNFKGFVDQATASYAGTPGNAASFRPLHRLLERQVYRLGFWRVAADEINYRRFFDINDLVGIRQEIPAVFDQCHRFVGRLIAEDKIQGLRIDHVDGLYDPGGYCRRLRAFAAENGAGAGFYLIVEKILAPEERLRADWAIDGTTGYDFLGLVNRLFVDPAGGIALDETYRRVTGDRLSFRAHAVATRHLVMETILASELNVLARMLDRLSEQNWFTRDYTLQRLHAALKEVVANFPVYRTYVTAAGCDEEDRRLIGAAVDRAKRRWAGPDREVLDFLFSALTGDLAKDRRGGFNRNEARRFAMRVQQYTAPVTAKGVEDTAFYRYSRLVSVNEVGSDPQSLALTTDAFHAANAERRRAWPRSMLATATHDTKHGEDMRLRLDFLSSMPEIWGETVERWRTLNRGHRVELDGAEAPSAVDEYMIYEILVGAWPMELLPKDSSADALAGFRDRVKEYLVKSVREAKLYSSWFDPHEDYEQACLGFLDAILAADSDTEFVAGARGLASRLAFAAALGSLSQLILKCFCPGVPDIYRGTELWDFSLVDPDNRRPVDFDERRRGVAALASARAAAGPLDPVRLAGLLAHWRDGQIKLYLLGASLRLRDAHPALFAEGSYEPIAAIGEDARHLVAFGRQHAGKLAIIAASRILPSHLTPGAQGKPAAWRDTILDLGPYSGRTLTDIFTGRRFSASGDDTSFRIAAADIFAALPLVVLIAA